jgi:hypothetical protein
MLLATLYIISIVISGYLATVALSKSQRDTHSELIGLPLALGTGLMSFLLFWISLAGIKPSQTVIAGIALSSILLFVVAKLSNLLPPITFQTSSSFFTLKKSNPWVIISGISFFSLSSLVMVSALSIPIFEWDAYSIWGYKAKILFNFSVNPKPQYFQDLSLSYSHLDYPLLVPLLMAGFYGALGNIDDQAVKVIFFLFYLALWFISYAGFRWKLSRKHSICLATMIVAVPSIVRWAGTGIADVPLTVYYSGSILFLLKWIENRERQDWVLSVLFTAFCVFTKNEGIALAIINLLVMAIFCNSRKNLSLVWALTFFPAVILVMLPYLLWSFDIPRTHENYISRIQLSILLDNIWRLELLLPQFANELLKISKWGLLWISGIALAILGWPAFKKNYVQAAWILFLLHIILYIFIYIITPWKVSDLLQISLDRLILHTVPAMGYIISFHWAEIYKSPNT